MEKEPQRMIFPYTWSAKIRNFPWKFYFRHHDVFRYTVFAAFVCAPVFWKIQQLSYSPGNVAKYEESKRKEEEHAKHRFDYH